MQGGLDSLGAVELRNAIASKFSITVPATLAFDFPSAEALSRFISASLSQSSNSGGQLEDLSGGGGDKDVVNLAQISAVVASIVQGVLGADVPSHQPLMEVSHVM